MEFYTGGSAVRERRPQFHSAWDGRGSTMNQCSTIASVSRAPESVIDVAAKTQRHARLIPSGGA